MRWRGQATSALTLGAASLYMVLVSWILWTGLSRDGDAKTLMLFGLMALLAAGSTWAGRRAA
jgi:hypothetical protein